MPELVRHRGASLRLLVGQDGGHGVFGSGLRKLVDDIRVLSSVTASTLESHMEGCDRRYEELSKDNQAWRVELGKRLDKQDTALERQNAAMTRLLWGVITMAVGILAIVLETIVRSVMHVVG